MSIDSPLVGYWREVQQISCDTGEAFEPDPRIEELVLRDTGDFSVTWQPFETYVDYWGTWTHDPETASIGLEIEGGNWVPTDFEGAGFANVVDDQLVFGELWLGSSNAGPVEPACGHVFE